HSILKLAHEPEGGWAAERKELVEFSLATRKSLFALSKLCGIFRMFAQMIEHGGFYSAEAEVKRIAARFRWTEFHRRGRTAGGRCQPVENRAAGIAQGEQLCHFVVGFARCVIARLAQLAVVKEGRRIPRAGIRSAHRV